MQSTLAGKKLLILGGNPETIPLVQIANEKGIKTIVASYIKSDAAKKYAWKSADIDCMDVDAIVSFAQEEKIDGVLVGVADRLVPAYCKVCERLGFPCYATQSIVDVFSYKDKFKSTCEKYGIKGIPQYYLDSDLKREDLDKIKYPVMVKPVDNGAGVGMTVCYKESELCDAVHKALENSKQGRFLVERYMLCDDVAIYYTFKDGYCSTSCLFDRNTSDEQPGFSRVNLGSIYPSKHTDEYFEKMHKNALRMFDEIGIRNGVLLLQVFYENGEFYSYDPGFRLTGEAPHLLMKAINGFDQRDMLINFALTGSMGDVDLKAQDDPYFRGKYASTLWFLLKEGTIGRIEGLENIEKDDRIYANVQRFFEGDRVLAEWTGTERQVLTRLYVICNTKEELAETLEEYMSKVKVYDVNGNNMLLHGFNARKSLDL